jgi:hypothetical protein
VLLKAKRGLHIGILLLELFQVFWRVDPFFAETALNAQVAGNRNVAKNNPFHGYVVSTTIGSRVTWDANNILRVALWTGFGRFHRSSNEKIFLSSWWLGFPLFWSNRKQHDCKVEYAKDDSDPSESDSFLAFYDSSAASVCFSRADSSHAVVYDPKSNEANNAESAYHSWFLACALSLEIWLHYTLLCLICH